MQRHVTLAYWVEDGWYVGKLQEILGLFSQGESLKEIEGNIEGACLMMVKETVSEPVRSKYWNALFPRRLWPHPFVPHSLNFSPIWPILTPIEDVVAEVKCVMNWKNLLGTLSESVNDRLRLRHDYLVAENRILRNQIDGRVRLTDRERKELAEIGAKLGKPALAEIATVTQADTILAWNRTFANQTVNSSAPPQSVGRPRVDQEIEDLVIRMARENRSWGYDRIQGSLKHLGYTISDQSVGNILKRHGIPPAPERTKTVTWGEFVRSHWAVFVATGFFNSEVWSWLRLIVSCLLSFIHSSRHSIQSMRGVRYQPMLAIRALVGRVHNWIDHRPRGVPLLEPRFRARQAGHRALTGQIGSESEIAFADARSVRFQELTKVVDVSSAFCRPIRDGPSCCRQSLDCVLIVHDCEAA